MKSIIEKMLASFFILIFFLAPEVQGQDALDISITTTTSYERNVNWSLETTASPSNWELFTGDSGTSTFTVSVNKTETDGDWTVSGTISITNNATSVAVITGVMSEISGQGTLLDACGIEISEANPVNLGPGGRLECDYSIPLPDGSDRVYTVTVTTAAGGDVLGGTGTANINFGEPTLLTGEPEDINVTSSLQDTYGPFSGDDQFTYTKTYNCGEDAGTNEEVATINETGDADNAIVTVNCYDLTVEKTATNSFTREWTWTIDKYCTGSFPGGPTAGSSPVDPLVLSPGQVYMAPYSVEVDASSQDIDHAVSGSITISNPHPTRDAVLTAVSDVVSPDIAANVDCGGNTTVPAGGSVICSYAATLPDATDRTNIATATLQNYSFASNGTATLQGTTDYSGNAAVTFDDTPDLEIDACINVDDTNIGFLGTVCAATSPTGFSYTQNLVFNSLDDCGPQTVENIASFRTNDTGMTGSDSCAVYVDVRCEFGCTLTPGYWKTHNESFYGGASKKADPTWQLIQPNAENSSFFLSGQSWYDVLWTPSQGNVYYNLARAYIAAYLNSINVNLPNGTDASAITTELADALAFFATYTPADVASLRGRDRKVWTDLASTLDDFNNGIIGPGKCDEDEISAEGLYAQATDQTTRLSVGDQLPTEQYQLESNWPNPVKSITIFGFSIPTAEKVQLRVYNINGQLVSTLTDSYLEAGRYEIMWDVPSNVAAGMYFYQMEAGSVLLTRRMLIIK